MTTGKPTPYKTLFRFTLQQCSAFSTGGTIGDARLDNPLARDGNNRLTLRGSGIAGALIAEARSLYTGADDLLSRISEGPPGQQNKQNTRRLRESLWRFHHAHPYSPVAGNTSQTSDYIEQAKVDRVSSEVRPGVAIDAFTGAAESHKLWSTEVVPVGTCWPVLIECDDYRDGPDMGVGKPDHHARALLAATLCHWRDAGCLLGRDVARGLGWMRILGDVQVYQLDTAQLSRWPNSEKSPDELLAELPKSTHGIDDLCLLLSRRISAPRIARGRIELRIGTDIQSDASKQGWGLDTLSLASDPAGRELQNRYLQDRQFVIDDLQGGGSEVDQQARYDTIDTVLSFTQQADGMVVPQLPGSSLRGALRQVLTKYGCNEITEELFGTTDDSARFLISDALPVAGCKPQPFLIEHHAEDEFTAGPYDGAKFNRLGFLNGVFQCSYRLELQARPPTNSKNTVLSDASRIRSVKPGDQSDAGELPEERRHLLRNTLDVFRQLGEQQWLPLGGNQWRGHGWIEWRWLPEDNSQEPLHE